jgi:hypothetical protein
LRWCWSSGHDRCWGWSRNRNGHRRRFCVGERQFDIFIHKSIDGAAHGQDCAGARHEKSGHWDKRNGPNDASGTRDALVVEIARQPDLAAIDTHKQQPRLKPP